MKPFLLLVVLAAACKPETPVVQAPAAAPAAPAPVAEQNAAVKYVGALQDDVKRAQEARDKMNAATKQSEDAQKALKQSQGE